MKRIIIAASAIFVILAAVSFYSSQNQQVRDGYCQDIERGIRENGTYNGTTFCYTPEQAKGNITVPEELRKRTDLACICANYHDGEKKIFTINLARKSTPIPFGN